MSYTDLREKLPLFITNEDIEEYCNFTIESKRSEIDFLDWICNIPLDLPDSN